MKVIRKYEIGTGVDCAAMPKGARILRVGNNEQGVCLWALVDSENLDELRHFRTYGTGDVLPEGFKEDRPSLAEYGEAYVGTAHLNSGVWHVFERRA